MSVKLPFRIADKPQRSSFSDQQIDDAIKRGEFDNLRGKGKPLNLTGDLSDKKALRAKIRHDNGFSAPWEDVAREIERATQRVESAARLAWEFRQAGMRSKKADPARIEADFQRSQKDIETQVAAINSLILKHNLLFPPQLPHLHRVRLKIGDVWEKVAPEWWAKQSS